MLVVRRHGGPDAGAPPPSLQSVEIPAAGALEGVGKATGWKAGRCRKVQVSELFSMEICDKAVMDFLAAIDVGKFPPG